MARDPALLGIFPDLDDFLTTLRKLKAAEHKILTVFSPIHFSEIQKILKHKTSTVRYLTLAGGILGGASLVGLAVYAHLSFKLITGGKPARSAARSSPPETMSAPAPRPASSRRMAPLPFAFTA